MRALANQTGGYFLIAEAFDHPTFKHSLNKAFAKGEDGHVRMGFGAQIDVLCSGGFKVCGAIGSLASVKKKTEYVGETEIGIGGTSAWKMCALDAKTTIAFYFECANQSGDIPAGQQRFFQFITKYVACPRRSSNSTQFPSTCWSVLFDVFRLECGC